MRFNSNQKYTRWSIRRLSVGVASVVVASGFFVLVGQPSSVHADEVNLTPAQVVPNHSSVTEKSELPENFLKEAVDTALPENQTISSSKEAVDETNSSEKTSTDSKEEVAKPKEAQDTPKANNPTEEQSKPEVAPATVGSQDREAPTPQSVTTPEEVKKGVAENTKETVDVPASYLEKANVPGPFTAGVNQVIPYEAFGGDGMLTRLLLKSSDKAPWSDNGTANNPALLPLEGLAKGQYFYEVDLNGNTTGKEGQALLDQLRANGTQAYQATVKVYGAKDGKPDLTNLIATKNVTVSLNGLVSKESVKDSVTKNIKDHIDVPASYLEKANVPGPFLAGVNQVIPYEAFGGDGMLTRLLLKSSDKAPWSDNGKANNPALLPLEGLAKGQYFYEVDLNGNTTGKEGQALLDQLRANGTQAYQATVKVYGAKDGKPDLTNLIATRQVTIQLRGKEVATTPSQQGQINTKPSVTDSMSKAKDMVIEEQHMSDMKVNHPSSSSMADTAKKFDKSTLPKTGEAQTATATIGFFGLALAGLLGLLGLRSKQED